MEDLIDLSRRYHADASLDWRRVTELAAACPWGVVNDEAVRRTAQARLQAMFQDDWLKVHTIATVEHIVGKPFSDLRTLDEMSGALDTAPGIDRPALLHAFWRRHWLDAEHLRAILLDAWRYTDFPCGPCSPVRGWVAMFRTAGFLSGGRPRPIRPLTVYRGSTPHGRRGMAWTTEQWVAENFADHWFNLGQAQKAGHVYKAKIYPRHILALMPEKTTRLPKIEVQPDGHLKQSATEFEEVPIKPEFEVIVDPDGLKEMILVEAARVRRARLVREGCLDEA